MLVFIYYFFEKDKKKIQCFEDKGLHVLYVYIPEKFGKDKKTCKEREGKKSYAVELEKYHNCEMH